MIPESWLKDRMATTDVREIARHELENYGFPDADLQKLLAQGPSARWLEKWQEFVRQRVAGDELWFFKSPPGTWSQFAGRAGYALVRSGRVIASIATGKS